MEILSEIIAVFLDTITDVLPIATIIFGFQFVVLRQKPANLDEILAGFAWVLVGLSLFLLGLKWCLFPLGRLMAEQLTDPAFILAGLDAKASIADIRWMDYYWVYIFAFLIGFSTTIAEPSLIAVAIKANEVSGGAIGIWGAAHLRRLRRRYRYFTGLLPYRRRGSYSLVHHKWLRHCGDTNDLRTKINYPAGLRLRWGNHIHGNGAAGSGAGAGTFGNSAGTQPTD